MTDQKNEKMKMKNKSCNEIKKIVLIFEARITNNLFEKKSHKYVI